MKLWQNWNANYGSSGSSNYDFIKKIMHLLGLATKVNKFPLHEKNIYCGV